MKSVMLIPKKDRCIYVPEAFTSGDFFCADMEECRKWGLTEENFSKWGEALNPSSVASGEAWQWIEENARKAMPDGTVYGLVFEGEGLFAVCIESLDKIASDFTAWRDYFSSPESVAVCELAEMKEKEFNNTSLEYRKNMIIAGLPLRDY